MCFCLPDLALTVTTASLKLYGRVCRYSTLFEGPHIRRLASLQVNASLWKARYTNSLFILPQIYHHTKDICIPSQLTLLSNVICFTCPGLPNDYHPPLLMFLSLTFKLQYLANSNLYPIMPMFLDKSLIHTLTLGAACKPSNPQNEGFVLACGRYISTHAVSTIHTTPS